MADESRIESFVEWGRKFLVSASYLGSQTDWDDDSRQG